jgi:hypothetical protein
MAGQISDRAAKVQYLTAWLYRYQTGLQRYCTIFDSLAGQISYRAAQVQYLTAWWTDSRKGQTGSKKGWTGIRKV